MEGLQRVGPLTAIPSLLGQFGQYPAKILSRAGVNPSILDNPENSIPFTDVGKLLEACVEATKCQHFGLLVGQQAGTESLGLVGRLMRNAPTLGRAIHDVCLNQQRYVKGSVVYLSIQEERAFWGYGIHHPGMKAIEQAYDLVMAMGFNIMRELCGVLPEHVRLARRAPHDDRPYLKIFGHRPIFDSEQTALEFSSSLLKQRVKTANPRVREELEQAVAKYWTVTQPSTRDQVIRILRARSVCGSAVLTGVAEDMGIHPRTLNRRLRNEGTNFRDLRNLARYEIARQLLTGTHMKITDVALALGYAETSIFIRAFHAWSGKSPATWRKQPWDETEADVAGTPRHRTLLASAQNSPR